LGGAPSTIAFGNHFLNSSAGTFGSGAAMGGATASLGVTSPPDSKYSIASSVRARGASRGVCVREKMSYHYTRELLTLRPQRHLVKINLQVVGHRIRLHERHMVSILLPRIAW